MRMKPRVWATGFFLLGSLTALAQGYSDLPQGHWAKEAVEVLTQKGILTGFPDGTFRGSDPATRYQVSLALYRLYQVLEARLKELEKVVREGRTPEAVVAAQQAAEAASLVTGALPPKAEEVALGLLEIRGRIQTLEESLARTMGEVRDLRAFQDALTALEGSQNAELVELRAQLDTIRQLLKDLVTRQEFVEAMQKLADGVQTLAQEVAKLKEFQKQAEERLKNLEAFAEPRKEDLSLKAAEAQGAWRTSDLPGPAREPAQGFGVSLTVARADSRLQAGAGEREGTPYASALWSRAGEKTSVIVSPGAALLGYADTSLRLEGWKAMGALGGALEARGQDLAFRLRAQYLEAPLPTREALGVIGQPLPAASGVEASLGLGNQEGGLQGQVGFLLTPSTRWARASLSVPLLPSLYLGGFYSQAWDRAFNAATEAEALSAYERRPSAYGLSALYRQGQGKDNRLEASFRYLWLPEGSGPGLTFLLDSPHLDLNLAGQYVAGANPWYKVYGEVRGSAEALTADLRFGLARSSSHYQAFFEGQLALTVREDLVLGLGYGEFAALRAYGAGLAFVPDLDTPYLYAGGSGSGLSQWTTLQVRLGGLGFRYDYLMRPRPADRFGLSYSFHLP